MEVWRAALKQDTSLLDQLGSTPVVECILAASQPLTKEGTLHKLEQLASLKGNSVVAEFAQRALLIKASGGYAAETPASVLFRQLTDYLVSRDIAGYVGRDFRCKTVAEVRALKEQIGEVIARKIQAVESQQALASKPWAEACPIILRHLQQS
jgi:hypothetical protein